MSIFFELLENIKSISSVGVGLCKIDIHTYNSGQKGFDVTILSCFFLEILCRLREGFFICARMAEKVKKTKIFCVIYQKKLFPKSVFCDTIRCMPIPMSYNNMKRFHTSSAGISVACVLRLCCFDRRRMIPRVFHKTEAFSNSKSY